MLKKIWNWITRKKPVPPVEVLDTPVKIIPRTFSTDLRRGESREDVVAEVLNKTFQRTHEDFKVIKSTSGTALDSKEVTAALDSTFAMKNGFNTLGSVVPTSQLAWYGSQSFIGYQMCAILSQHWLVYKACAMPAEDAVRNGYQITVNDGTEIDAAILDDMRKLDVTYKINDQLTKFISQGRIFGIRIAIFKVKSNDPEYYTKPFNPDGITPNSYEGIAQVDPYWITPELDMDAASNPASQHFYEPTWWRVNGVRYHRTHLVIFTTGEIPDLLKPTYYYGGVPVPQKIYERVYAAERTANEAPQLALSKRTTIYKTDLAQAQANQADFENNIRDWSVQWNNYGIKTCDKESEDMMQFDTSLADLDAVIMSQYQLVAAASNTPAVKLLGTTPKGFNATGAYEEKSYHEELKSIQTHDLSPLIERHHLLLIRSEIAPKYKIEPFDTTVVWNPLNEVTAEQLAALNKMKAETGQVLMASGAIDGEDERNRIINDPASGYTGVDADMPEEENPDIQSDPDYA